MVAAVGVIQYVFAVVLAKTGQRLGLRQLVNLGKGQKLARALILIRCIDGSAIFEACWREFIFGLDDGHGVGEFNGFWGVS